MRGAWGSKPLRQIGSTFLIAEEPPELPEDPADAVISIDGELFRHPVRLLEGISPDQIETPIRPDDAIPI